MSHLLRHLRWSVVYRSIRAVADQPAAGTLALLLLSTVGMVSTALLLGLPVPRVHDEFAYLLMGDTFAQGRLTNPTPPFWRHFEAFHIIFEPTYQAKYPPAQGLFLAIGIVLGHPVVGVWLSVLLMIGATAWALRGLLEPRWAFFATLLLVFALGVAGNWAQTYWGGAVSAGGGALVYGGTLRLVAGSATRRDGMLAGVGLAILANSRPLEGLLLVTAAGGWIVLDGLRHRDSARGAGSAAAFALLVGTGGILGTAAYNHAVTRSATIFPYTVHTEHYALSPSFFILPPAGEARADIHPDIEKLNVAWEEQRRRAREDGIRGIAERGARLLGIVGGPGVVLLLLLPLAWRAQGTKGTLALFLVVLIPVLLTTAARPHYLAAATAPLYGLIGLTVRRLASRGTKPLGVPLLVAIVVLAVVDPAGYVRDQLARNNDWAHQRQALLEDLLRTPSPDLVFVHYPENHNLHADWVFNRPRIDDADVIWARSLNPRADSALVAYFADRRVWELHVDRNSQPVTLVERPDTARTPPGQIGN